MAQDLQRFTMLNIHAGYVYHNKTHSMNQPFMTSLPFDSQSLFLRVIVILSFVRVFKKYVKCNFCSISLGRKVLWIRMRFVQSCTQRKRYILKHGQELITFYANHICVVYVFLVQKLSRLKRYLLLPASRNRGITSRKHSARILTCGASRQRYVLYGK